MTEDIKKLKEWMATYTGKVTASAIQRKFRISIRRAICLYDELVRQRIIADPERMKDLQQESKKQAAEEMYETLAGICENCGNRGCEETCEAAGCKIGKILKKARGESWASLIPSLVLSLVPSSAS